MCMLGSVIHTWIIHNSALALIPTLKNCETMRVQRSNLSGQATHSSVSAVTFQLLGSLWEPCVSPLGRLIPRLFCVRFWLRFLPSSISSLLAVVAATTCQTCLVVVFAELCMCVYVGYHMVWLCAHMFDQDACWLLPSWHFCLLQVANLFCGAHTLVAIHAGTRTWVHATSGDRCSAYTVLQAPTPATMLWHL